MNLTCENQFWISELSRQTSSDDQIQATRSGKIVLEYASPNTNKPLHLGHIRNVLLGWSVGQLLKAIGYDVHYTQVVNDRGVAICKSMLSWQKFNSDKTPESTGIKSDHFVGEAYVQFSRELEKEYNSWQQTSEAKELLAEQNINNENSEQFFKGYKNDYFNTFSKLGRETRDMLLAWENNDPPTRALWTKMNTWFMKGFMKTCDRLGILFDSMNYESETYLLGKDIIAEGIKSGIFYKEDDGSVWVDLSDVKLDKKIVLRSDGTSVYMTQDLGTARVRYQNHQMDGMIYTVGNEQDYHFQVLFEILKRLGEPYADQLYHLSYGMVDLPTGRMKTRDGTVVDADDLMDEVLEKVRLNSVARGELDMLTEEAREKIFETISMGALKYYLLRVEARKRMLFNPEESVDLQGQTGPYIQNAYVRIKSIMRKIEKEDLDDYSNYGHVNEEEKQVLSTLMRYGEEVQNAALKYDPSIIAAYAYQLARHFHRFYHDHSVSKAENKYAKAFRYNLAKSVADRLQSAMYFLGIHMPDRM